MRKGIMTRTMVLAVLLGMAAAASAQDFKLDVGFSGGANDLTGVNYADSSYNPSAYPMVDPTVALSYLIKFDKTSSLNLGLSVDDNMVFLPAKKNSKIALAVPGLASTYTNNDSLGQDMLFAQSLKFVSGATLKAGDFQAVLQLPLLINVAASGNTADAAAAVNGKALKYLAAWMANKTGNTASASNQAIAYDGVNSILFAASAKVSYKIVLGDGFSLTPLVESDLALVPFWLADVFATLTVQTGPVVTDLKASFYNTPNDPMNLDAVNGGALVYTWLDPKVTLDFTNLGVKGLKLYVGASIPVTTSTNAASAVTSLYGASITPGISWKIDNLSLDLSSAISNIDQGITGSPTSIPAFTSKAEWDPKLKVTYTFAF